MLNKVKRWAIASRCERRAIALFLAIIVWGGSPTIALSQQLESRLSRLESEFYGIESRLNQIESQLSQVSRIPAPRSPFLSPPPRTQTQGERNQMFDRLATLVIELKERIKQLETRVAKLESRR